MGRMLEVLRERISEDEDFWDNCRRSLVEWALPHPLMAVSHCLGRQARAHFPLLYTIRVDSPSYVGEILWLDPPSVHGLLEEFRRVRRVCHWQEFVPELDGARVLECWREERDPVEFESHVDGLERLLSRAVEQDYWVLLCL